MFRLAYLSKCLRRVSRASSTLVFNAIIISSLILPNLSTFIGKAQAAGPAKAEQPAAATTATTTVATASVSPTVVVVTTGGKSSTVTQTGTPTPTGTTVTPATPSPSATPVPTGTVDPIGTIEATGTSTPPVEETPTETPTSIPSATPTATAPLTITMTSSTNYVTPGNIHYLYWNITGWKGDTSGLSLMFMVPPGFTLQGNPGGQYDATTSTLSLPVTCLTGQTGWLAPDDAIGSFRFQADCSVSE